MNQLKCREWDFGVIGIRKAGWHYWGYIDGQWEETIYGKPHESQGLFTGLSDKRDKEIYEGDIVKYTIRFIGFTANKTEITTVKYGARLWECGFWPFTEFNGGKPIECEVIGNIYENKELLNESR